MKEIFQANDRSLKIPGWAQPIRDVVFGVQNERIEALIDNFFRLTPEMRTIVTGVSIGMAVLVFVFSIVFYFFTLSYLDRDLSDSFQALQDLQNLQLEHNRSRQSFDSLKKVIDESTKNFIFITYIDEQSQKMGFKAQGFPAQPPRTSFPSDHPFSASYQMEEVTFTVSEISLKQLVEYLVSLMSVSPFMVLKTLQLRVSLTNSSFLNAKIGLETIVPVSS